RCQSPCSEIVTLNEIELTVLDDLCEPLRGSEIQTAFLGQIHHGKPDRLCGRDEGVRVRRRTWHAERDRHGGAIGGTKGIEDRLPGPANESRVAKIEN